MTITTAAAQAIINDAIISNGTGQITAPVLANVLTNVVNAIPAITAPVTARAAPSGYSWFDNDFQITRCDAPGLAQLVTRTTGADATADYSFINYAKAKFASQLNSSAVYVSPQGSDSNTGTISSPFLTLSKAINSSTASYVCLYGFTYDNPCAPYGYRASDAGGGAMKIVRSLGEPSVIAVSGTNIARATWTNSSGTYSTTVSGFVARVLWRDPGGSVRQLRNYATLSALNAVSAAYGWFCDTSGNLAVRLGGNSVLFDQMNLRAVYSNTTPASAGDPRLLFYSSNIAFENVIFDGVYPYALYNASPSFMAFKDCRFQYSPNYGVLCDSSTAITQDCIAYRNYADGINYKSSSAPAYGIEHNILSEYNGETDTLGVENQLTNVNGSSNDAAMAGSGVVRINGIYRKTDGPSLPDTFSWNVGVRAGHTQTSPAAVSSDADFWCDTAGGQVWCDTCDASSTFGYVANPGNISLYNCKGTSATSGGGSINSYSPF